MSCFELVRRNITAEDFDLVNFLHSRSPLTPKCEDAVVAMEKLDLDAVRDCIIWNLYHQGFALNTKTTRKLIEYLEGDFSDITKTVFLQVLVHYTKINVAKMYDTYSTIFKISTMPDDDKDCIDEYFDTKIADFVGIAMAQTPVMYQVVEIPDEGKSLIQKALLTESVLLAFQVCLGDVLASDNACNDISFKWLKNEISKMKIYMVDYFFPLKGLRGACLIDGILISTGELARKSTEVHEADLITIAVHECSNYLARCKFRNFNFSSPFSHVPKMCEKRTDVVFLENNMEIGRCVELLLFDGIQPLWSSTSIKAAEKFFERLWSSRSYPIIPKALRKDLGLMIRIPPASSFGIDVEDYDTFC